MPQQAQNHPTLPVIGKSVSCGASRATCVQRLALSLVCLGYWLGAAGALLADDEKITYEKHLAPILRQRCGSCHNPTQRTADLDVTNYLSLMQGGASGPVIEAGDPSLSYLYSLVTREAEPFMPPNTDKIPDKEIDILRRWIEGGALENDSSKPVKPKPQMSLAIDADPGQRPEIVAYPLRMVLEPHFIAPKAPMARSIATSPWAPLVALAGQRQILLYDTKTLELLGLFAFPEGQPNVVRFSRDGKILLTGGGHPAASGLVVGWDVTTGERLFEVGDELDAVLAADLSADHARVALGGPQRLVRVYSTTTGELLYELDKHTEWITALEFSPDGILLATADRNGGLQLWETHSGNEYLSLAGHSASITGVSWRRDSNLLATCSEDASVRLWEPENGKQVKTWNAKSPLLSIAFARDGRIATGGRDKIARLWDQNGKALIETPPMSDITISVALCNESNRLIAADWAGNVHVVEIDSKTQQGTLATNPPKLEVRLASAQEQLQQAESKAAPLTAARAGAEEVLAATTTQVASLQKEIDKRNDRIQTLAKDLESHQKTQADLTKQQTALAERSANVQQAAPLVSEALRHLTEALAKQPDDAELTTLQQDLTKQLAKMEEDSAKVDVELAELAKQLAGAMQHNKQRNDELEALRKELAPFTEQMAQLRKTLAQQEAAVGAAREQEASAKAAVDEAQQALARWKSEIEFRDEMARLRLELDAAQQAAQEQQTEVDAAGEQLKSAQAALDAAQQKLSERTRRIEELHSTIDQARQPAAAGQ